MRHKERGFSCLYQLAAFELGFAFFHKGGHTFLEIFGLEERQKLQEYVNEHFYAEYLDGLKGNPRQNLMSVCRVHQD